MISEKCLLPHHIYIHDDLKGGGIAIFDKEGNFIKRISNGKDPGELVRLYDIDFDENNNELVRISILICCFLLLPVSIFANSDCPLLFSIS